MISFIKKHKIILIFLILATTLRLVSINQSLWLDEAIGAIEVRDNSYTHLFFEFSKFDNHPPLYYLVLKFWSGLFGYSEASLRFPSILFGVGTILLTYLIAKKIGKKGRKYDSGITRRVSLSSALLITTSQFHIYYSQEARMYSMATFFAALSTFAFLIVSGRFQTLRRFGTLAWILFSLSITVLVFTDYVPIFLIPVFWLYGILKKKDGDWWLRFVASFIPLTILFLIWLPIFKIQAENGRWLLSILPAWKSVVGGATVKQAVLVWTKFVFGRISLLDKKLYFLLIGLASLPILTSFYQATRKKERSVVLIWLWLILPLSLGFLVSFIFPAFIYFRFLYVLPAFYLTISWGIYQIKSKFLSRMVFFTLIAFNFLSFLIYVYDEVEQREQWRQAVSLIEHNAREGDVALFEYPEPFAPYRWYAKGKINALGATDSISADNQKTSKITREIVENKGGIFYFEYLRDLSDPTRVVERVLKEEKFEISEVYNFVGVGQVFYWKR
ncbi:hypothetical protein A2686_03195 [Candidatus Woesebacteria bacterium RIFCSPHIGHO2_01_FULL_38_10]|nr:MAG: hypothetical protein A2686_03195 [Candidatus Woesebacteria bacterium RIFCSPHIGHO2_01_FULL_38_10]